MGSLFYSLVFTWSLRAIIINGARGGWRIHKNSIIGSKSKYVCFSFALFLLSPLLLGTYRRCITLAYLLNPPPSFLSPQLLLLLLEQCQPLGTYFFIAQLPRRLLQSSSHDHPSSFRFANVSHSYLPTHCLPDWRFNWTRTPTTLFYWTMFLVAAVGRRIATAFRHHPPKKEITTNQPRRRWCPLPSAFKSPIRAHSKLSTSNIRVIVKLPIAVSILSSPSSS